MISRIVVYILLTAASDSALSSSSISCKQLFASSDRPAANYREVYQQLKGTYSGEVSMTANGAASKVDYLIAGQSKGSLYFTMKNSIELHIVYLEVEEGLRGTGISRLLLGKVLAEFPNTKSIITTLDQDNLSVAVAAVDAGASTIEAAKATPAYKIRASFGFKNIRIIDTYGNVPAEFESTR